MNRTKHENTTPYIKHLAESTNFKVGAFNENCIGLKRNRFEMPNVSYTSTLCVSVKNQTTIEITTNIN
jgi:hypothetical protein